jgi:uncharacterized protein
MISAEELIRTLRLEPLPIEGGYFRETYRSTESITAECLSRRYGSSRSVCTAIYYMLTAEPQCFSAIHRVKSDEIFHFYLGDPVEMLVLKPDGNAEVVVLGHEVAEDQVPQYVVPNGYFQGCRLVPGGRLALMGTTVAPGFSYDDFVLADRAELLSAYPSHAERIRALTRPA